MSNEEFKLESILKAEYMEILKREELYRRDKSREIWIMEGDSNTKSLHAFAKVRRTFNKIISIKDEKGIWCSSRKEIEQASLDHFMKILGDDPLRTDHISFITKNIESLVSPKDNKMLMAPFSIGDIKEATFALHPLRAPGPNGYTIEVFQFSRDFMGNDIWAVFEQFRKKKRFVRELNHTMIVLIPKK
ncbi:uncharacterized protein LOC131876750 [Cryptomeria japonica]|uniref:uncharacterized protein LOC131876750 n=1 Tax=Cryptomeria japonica TaxID=3369 RepID=UPI0027DA6FB2|nr:uncharacterized protein LOC131876750 [Cryptomeria japonica]